MVLEKLSSALKESLRKIVRVGLVDKKVIEELVTSIKTALISSDVNIELANKICEKIKKRALSEKPPKSLTAREHTVNIVYYPIRESEEIKYMLS